MSSKIITKRNIFVLGMFAVLATVIVLSTISTQNDQISQEFEEVTIETSGEIEAVGFNELKEKSETVLIGTVKEILPSKWNTPDGKRPAKLINDLGPNDTIYTDIVVSIDEYLVNPLDQKEVVIRIEGGEDEYTTMDVDYEPSFKPNEKVLLYLSKDISPLLKDSGQEHYIVTGFHQGKFTLTDDGMAVRTDKTLYLEDLVKIIEYGDDEKSNESDYLAGFPE